MRSAGLVSEFLHNGAKKAEREQRVYYLKHLDNERDQWRIFWSDRKFITTKTNKAAQHAQNIGRLATT